MSFATAFSGLGQKLTVAYGYAELLATGLAPRLLREAIAYFNFEVLGD